MAKTSIEREIAALTGNSLREDKLPQLERTYKNTQQALIAAAIAAGVEVSRPFTALAAAVGPALTAPQTAFNAALTARNDAETAYKAMLKAIGDLEKEAQSPAVLLMLKNIKTTLFAILVVLAGGGVLGTTMMKSSTDTPSAGAKPGTPIESIDIEDDPREISDAAQKDKVQKKILKKAIADLVKQLKDATGVPQAKRREWLETEVNRIRNLCGDAAAAYVLEAVKAEARLALIDPRTVGRE